MVNNSDKDNILREEVTSIPLSSIPLTQINPDDIKYRRII